MKAIVMMLNYLNARKISEALSAGILSLVMISTAQAEPLAESREIIFTGTDLATKAQELATPAAMYEYVRNTHEYALYHGSRSNTINTYGGLRGSDVDIASVLIAMYRSQGIPARYAVGTVSVPQADVANWLAVKDTGLAQAIMQDQGIQGVTLVNGQLNFEHVWVQVQVPFDNYRGAIPSTINCSATPERCQWISVDPSYKLRRINDHNINIHDALSFDYTRYYDAIKANDLAYRDKHPLEIFEQQVQDWLPNNGFTGKTLEDVSDKGSIIEEHSDLLPASLPYQVVGSVNTYDDIVSHDAVAGVKKWAKFVKLTADLKVTLLFPTRAGTATLNLGTFALADLTTKRLTLQVEPTTATLSFFTVRLDNTIVNSIGLGDGFTYSTSAGTYHLYAINTFTLHGDLDGSPAITTGAADQVVSVQYDNLLVGGTHLVATGGYTSNWSQVHRAADQLLAANRQYKIVYNPSEPGCSIATGLGCTPYIDANINGTIDAGESKLMDNYTANNALTGGLLFTAASLYYAQFVERQLKLDALNHVTTLIDGFLGVVSSTDKVEYIGDTPFAVLPGGLLIDIKGLQFNGSYLDNQPNNQSSKHFELLGHIGSSLEHEIWQELTGYDAISTVRGFQFARAQNTLLATLNKTTLANNTAAANEWVKFGFSTTPTLQSFGYPTNDQFLFGAVGFYYNPALNKNLRVYYSSFGGGSSMEVMQRRLITDGSTIYALLRPLATQRAVATVDWNPANPTATTAANVDCYARNLADLNLAIPNTATNWVTDRHYLFNHNCNFGGAYNTGGGAFFLFREPVSALGASANSLYAIFADSFNTYYVNRRNFLNYFDANLSYSEADHVFRNLSNLTNYNIDSLIVAGYRDDVLLTTSSNVEYVIPGRMVGTSNNLFNVYLRKTYNTQGVLTGQLFAIANAGGGYVDGTIKLTPATAVASGGTTLPSFNNSQFTDQLVVSQTNNDLIRTPSTADPVSTVTGNNYHDETDIMIKGRGLNYGFTRTYNSAKSATGTDGPFGFGWTHSYNMRLKSNDFGLCPNCTPGTNTAAGQRPENGNGKTASFSYLDERGGEHNYLIDETTFAVTPPRGEYDSLVLNTPVAGQYTLTFRNGVKYIFENPEHASADMRTVPGKTARLLRIEDPYGSQLLFSYDAATAGGKLTRISDNLGIAARTGLAITYVAGTGHIKDITDWSGRKWSFGYDSAGNLQTKANPLNETITYTYQPNSHNLFEVVLPLQRGGKPVKTAFQYYQDGRTFNYTDNLGNAETLDYDVYRRRTRVTDARGGIREYNYDDSGAMTQLKEPDGALMRFDNSADGLRNQRTDPLGYATQYSYRLDKAFTGLSDTGGQVSLQRNALAQNIAMTYGPYDQLASITDAKGVTTSMGFYTTAGTCSFIGRPKELRISSLAGQSNVLLREFCWNTDGTLQSQTDYIDPSNTARKRVVSYTYEAGTNGLNVSDITITGSGQTIHNHFTYDNLGRRTSETFDRRTSPTNAAIIGLKTSYQYDALGRLTQVADAGGIVRQTVFDANGQIAQDIMKYKQPDGSFINRTMATHQYDAADRRVATTDLLGNTTRFAYDEAGNTTTVTDANGHTRHYEYDALNRQTASIDANGHRTEITYNQRGEVIAITNANGETGKNSYDAIGRLTQATDALGFQTQYRYDANGNVVCQIDANALSTASDPGHQPVNSDGCTESRRYDELNRITQTIDAQGNVTAYNYDLRDNRISITDAEGRITRFNYDDLGRLIETVDPLIETPVDLTRKFSYDQADNLIQDTDRKGQVTQYTYDALNRNTQALHLANNSQETYTYNSFGDLVQSRNGQITYSYTYDTAHRLTSKTDSRLNKTLNWTYDKAGNLKTKTDYQRDVTTYQYDSTDRLVAETNPAYVQVSYHYDGAGRLLDRILSNGAKTQYRYDAGGRLSQLTNTTVTGQIVNDTTYTRDRVGNILTTTDTQGAASYQYDPVYRLLTANGGAAVNVAAKAQGATATASSYLSHSSGEYLPDGAIDGDHVHWLPPNAGPGIPANGWVDATYNGEFPDWLQVDFNGTKTIDTINVYTVQDNFPTPIEPTLATPFTLYGPQDFTVQYWNGTGWQTVPGGAVTGNNKVWRQFSFTPVATTAIRVTITKAADGASRIIELEAYARGNGSQETYTYDKVGNRKTQTVAGTTQYYNVNAGNRLTDIRTGSATGPVYESYQYDANGSLTQISGSRNLSLTWDANNRASAISGRTYSYDPADYRIGKGGTGATLNYYLDGEHLDAVYDGGITVQSQHLRGSIIDEVVYSYQRDSSGKLVAATSHHDALQSVLGESNHQGAIQYRQSYTAFGTATNTSQPQRYTGREMDSESGLYYYRARYYDPVIGRFISEDPLGFQAGVNFYSYCLNNPVNCSDPSGNVANLLAAAGGGIIGGVSGAVTAFVKSQGNLNSTLTGGLLGAGFGALTGATFGANIAGSGALTGIFAAAGGNAFGQFTGNKGKINLTEVASSGAFGAIPGGTQSFLINDAVNSGLGQNTVNALGSLALVGQFKIGSEALNQGVSNALPEFNVDLSKYYNLYNKTQQNLISKARSFVSPVFTNNSALISSINSTADTINSQIAPQALSNISVDFLGFGQDTITANGGFVLYPNKPNNNTAQAVYRK